MKCIKYAHQNTNICSRIDMVSKIINKILKSFLQGCLQAHSNCIIQYDLIQQQQRELIIRNKALLLIVIQYTQRLSYRKSIFETNS